MRVRKLPAPSKPGHALFAAASPLGRTLPKQTFYKLPRRRSVRGGALSYPFHLHLRQTTAFTSPLSRATAQALHPMPGCSDRAIRMQTGKSRPPGPAFFIETFTLHHTPYKSPSAHFPSRQSETWSESAPMGFCMFPEFSLPKSAFAKIVIEL